MTVNFIDGDKVYTVWFADANLCRGTFSKDALRIVGIDEALHT